jgi:subtilase family serine protease
MHLTTRQWLRLGVAGTALTGMAALTPAARAAIPQSAPQITAPINDGATITMQRDVSSGVRISKDAGALADDTALPHIRLELKRPAVLQAALDQLVRDQQTKGSARYRQWLTPAQLRAYGPAQADIDKITVWLTSHGLAVNSVSRSGMEIDFGGTAGQVARVFHTSLHSLTLNGERHIANVTAAAIPAALAPAIVGVTLHNFFPHPNLQHITPEFNVAGSPKYYAVAPGDFNTIYNVNPLLGSANGFGQPIRGAGVTIAVVEQTNIRAGDWAHFRKAFGLSGYAGTFTSTHPGGCPNPGMNGDEVEAAIDAEWASAPAPDAAIQEAACATTAPLYFGVETALQNLVEQPSTATVLSISYGGAEIQNGFAFTAGWTNLCEEGAAEGKAIFVSSGDSGSAVDRNTISSDGLGVNALSDSAYVVAVGGTDFLDGSQGTFSDYWKKANSATGESAKSYIPETPWNNSCAGSVLFGVLGYSSPGQSCAADPFVGQAGVGGTGGQSIYATKPSWQLTTIPGMLNDNARDQPDVSLFAANGLWSHFYLICMSDPNEGGSGCNYNNRNDVFGNAYGGTSVAAPAFAGIAALIQQVAGATGNIAPTLYKIANAQFNSTSGLAPCNASLGTTISAACAFNIVTAGNISQPCNAGTLNCTASPGQAYGYLANRAVSPGPAWHAGLGYSLATGLGSVNATNLLYNYLNTF